MAGFLDAMAAYLDRLSFREKVMVGGMVGAMLAFVLFMGAFFTLSKLADLQSSLDQKQQALATIMRHTDAYMEKTSASGRSMEQIETNDLRLTPFVEEIATALNITVDHYDERRNPIAAQKGDRASHRATDGQADLWEETLTVSFKQVSLDQLTGFLDQIHDSQRLAIIKKLNLRTEWSDKSKLDVTVTLATYKKA